MTADIRHVGVLPLLGVFPHLTLHNVFIRSTCTNAVYMKGKLINGNTTKYMGESCKFP